MDQEAQIGYRGNQALPGGKKYFSVHADDDDSRDKRPILTQDGM